ncbi:MAG: protein-glutamate O-methyltransferase CheR [Gammaproteobacteria bacterium]|nr:protein-glutamate O-methyltransferase CheR [Gammaproteobacteria bacterium]
MTADEREFQFTDRDFAFLRQIAYEHTGITLGDTKRQMVYGRLARRIRQLGLDSFAAYCQRIENDLDSELGELVNAITTNLTSFFRENHHFEHLTDTALPEIVAHNAGARRLRVWSAGCSTGEEPYSIAMTLAESGQLSGWDARILATDIDTNVVAKARSGVYGDERIQDIAPQRLRRWFQRGGGANAGKARVAQPLRDMISFRQLNLLGPWPMQGPFDVIFCRNVVIYFDKETQRKLFARYADLLAPHGYLYIGHSETLFKISEQFRLIGGTIYKKV